MDRGVDAVGEMGDELRQADSPDGLHDLGVGGGGPGERDVVADRASEEVGLLGTTPSCRRSDFSVTLRRS